MSRRTLLWVAGGLVAAALVALLWWTAAERGERGDVPRADGTGELEAGQPAVFTLYFPGPGGLLHPEERELAVEEDGRGRGQARALVLALLGGPETEGLVAPFPAEVGLLDLYIDPDGVAFVDLGGDGDDVPAGTSAGGEDGPGAGGARQPVEPPEGGSREEMQRVYSVVHTLTGNLPGISRVVLLWNGRQLPSFAGHLDTSIPLWPKPDLVAPAGRGEEGAP